MRTTVAIAALAVALAVAPACSDDRSDDGGGASAASDEPDTSEGADRADGAVEPLAGGGPAAPSAGEVALALGGGLEATLEITACERAPDAQPDGEVPAELLGITARGSTADGEEVNLEIRRFRSRGASPTITDTVTIVVGDLDAPDRALVAQRFEVEGVVTDPRDPEADDPLLRVRDGRVDAEGVFAPPGAFADDPGLVAGALVAAC